MSSASQKTDPIEPREAAIDRAGALPEREPYDTFRGDDRALVACIKALLDLDAAGALVPHGLGGHARGLLGAAAVRLATAVMELERIRCVLAT